MESMESEVLYLTDRIESVADSVRHQDTITLADDLSDFTLPSQIVCAASSDERAASLCAGLGLSSPLPRVSATYQPGDRALVGSWEPDGRMHWCLRTFT